MYSGLLRFLRGNWQTRQIDNFWAQTEANPANWDEELNIAIRNCDIAINSKFRVIFKNCDIAINSKNRANFENCDIAINSKIQSIYTVT